MFSKDAYYNAGRECDPELPKLLQQSREAETHRARKPVFASCSAS